MTTQATSADAFASAKHRAKYAHRDCVVWEDASGWNVADYSREAVKAALIAVGTAGRFSIVGAKVSSRVGWRRGVRILRSFSVKG